MNGPDSSAELNYDYFMTINTRQNTYLEDNEIDKSIDSHQLEFLLHLAHRNVHLRLIAPQSDVSLVLQYTITVSIELVRT